MTDDRATLADVLAATRELRAADRRAAAAWAQPLGRDVARAVRECPSYAWLRALTQELDQVLPLLRFGARVSLSIPERAWADEYMRKNPAPPNEALLAAFARSKSADPAERAAARAWIEADHERFEGTRLGRALALRATPEMLAERIDDLRAMLDVERMALALARRPRTESAADREERLIAEAIADQRKVLEEPDTLTQSGLWGGVGGNAFRRVSKAGADVIIAEGQKLQEAHRRR